MGGAEDYIHAEYNITAALGKPGKEYLGWVTKRIREENLKDKVTDEEKIEYAKQAEEKRAENKEALVLSLTRKKTVSVAQQQLDSIYQQVSLTSYFCHWILP